MSDRPSEPAETPIVVGVGLIRRGDLFLVRRRPEGKVLGGYWEFPGGKCEPGESAAEAALRECREELGIEVTLRGLRRFTSYSYPHGRVELYYFDGTTRDATEDPALETGFVWVPACELVKLKFPEANVPLLLELTLEVDRSGGVGSC
jgi:8-oxo-dGTP diphosphatase